ncbi:hypothetical protein SCP_0307510 [Sparassis crispa]|uniref:Transcription activator of gluconeogenesis ERT1 n=1 Tax=Sparassis crispa TaxID=139825 RepID=A0A401GFR9_9APHY|nr:hypothetical protein SCP_0307510 [Sparassis crispa]GBE81028.1 hypothetical protein SCP_0307510 [Sparassis crispa]
MLSQSHSEPLLSVPSASTSVMTQAVLPPFQHSSSTSDVPAERSDGKKKTTAKRRRPNDGASDSADSSSQAVRTRDGPKKKKANRACFHCQKAHLTCDDSRPCQRCVKRGMAANCTEGHRKKAKYLFDDEELQALKRSKSGESSKSVEPVSVPESQPEFAPPDPIFQQYAPTTSFALGSEGANLEYSILSAILGNSPDGGSPGTSASHANSHTHQHTHQHTQASSSFTASASTSNLVSATWPAEPLGEQYTGSNSMPAGADGYSGPAPVPSSYSEHAQQNLVIQPADTTLSSSSAPMAVSTMSSSHDYSAPGSSGFVPPGQYAQQQSGPMTVPQTNGREYHYADFGAGGGSERAQGQGQSSNSQYGQGMSGAETASPTGYMRLTRRVGLSFRTEKQPVWGALPDTSGLSSVATATGAGVYHSVTKPYDYTEGYHFLMKHIPRRFEKNDILRIVRALAIFRPSLIALQMPLSEEDEVFVEKCFQRSLIELDKLVSFSGTPTVAWRRTGEICLVGPEFCMLTGWEKEELVGRRKYIYELFENQSVVEYWENFANHAFENTTQSVYAHCVLLKPSGAPVPCTFCFSIRRDIMDLPSIVIGQWLPLI